MNYSREFDSVLVQYPLTLQEGVPIGVDEPTLRPRGFGSPRGMGRTPFTYRSPQLRFSGSLFRLHQGDIHGGKRDGINGPFTKQEAANRCGCLPRDLCPGPMAAIDEGDKIRTIYAGSFGGANAHIQQNSTEKTTAPTVMDCVHGIHCFGQQVMLQTRVLLPQDMGRLPVALTPCRKGVCGTGPRKTLYLLASKGQMFQRPTGESRFSNLDGSTKWRRLINNCGSTK